MTVIALTTFTLVAFAANSLLCRMALGADLIDPVSFTTIRLGSGALFLIVVARAVAGSGQSFRSTGSWGSALALFAYAIGFSLAYVTLSTGMGALILFGMVQITMIAHAVKSGERLGAAQWFGSAVALGGLVYLVAPGITAPDPYGACLMAVAGIAWGIYSIRGAGVPFPIRTTAGNFGRTVPLIVVASAIAVPWSRMEANGVLLALASGIVTSGLGYVLWYRTLKDLTTSQASVVQLLVPVIAAFGGVSFLSEEISMRLLIASALILGGVAAAIVKRKPVVAVDRA